MIKGEVDVRKCLRLDSLGRVNDKDRAVTGRKASGYLIVKVHMTWGYRSGLKIYSSPSFAL